VWNCGSSTESATVSACIFTEWSGKLRSTLDPSLAESGRWSKESDGQQATAPMHD
jgi:hypothetical protein